MKVPSASTGFQRPVNLLWQAACGRRYLGGMVLAVYAHPWDLVTLQRDGGMQRLVDLGIGEVALAVSYHAGRWLTPWQQGMVRFLQDGIVHFRPQAGYGRLQPLASREVPATGSSPLQALCEAAAASGLAARAWTVCTHNTRLGELHADCCVENAFGDRYSYALCPAQPAVQQYVAALVRDIAGHQGLGSIELEAFGWMGHRHNSHHDKSSFAAAAGSDVLLSLCFCDACRRGMQAQDGGGLDVEALRLQVQQLLRRHFTDGDAMAPGAAMTLEQVRAELGDSLRAAQGFRLSTLAAGVAAAREVGAASGLRVALQTNHDTLRGGPALPLAILGGMVDEAVLTTYGESPDGVAKALPHLAAARGSAPNGLPTLRLSLHPKAPQYQTDADLERVAELCREHGVGSVAIYHLGLLPWRTLARAAKVLGR